MKYKKGDQVVLLHLHPEYGRYGISDGWGEIFTVMEMYGDQRNFMITGHGHAYSVWAEMVELAGGPW